VTGHHERRSGVEHGDVARRATVASKHRPHDVGVVRRVATGQFVERCRREPEGHRIHLERPDAFGFDGQHA